MASPPTQALPTNKLPPLNSYLFTPPEQIHDSFSQSSAKETPSQWQVPTKHQLAPIQSAVPSPPTTPETKVHENLRATTPNRWHGPDRPLFPEHAAREGPNADAPLFETDSQPATFATIRTNSPQPIEPSVDSATRAVSRSSISDSPDSNWGSRVGGNLFIKNTPKAKRMWYNECMAEIASIRQAQRLPQPVPSASSKRDSYTANILRSVDKPSGITKQRHVVKPLPKPKASKVTSSATKATPPARRTPKEKPAYEFVDMNHQQQANTPKYKRAAPSKKVDKGDDREWRDVPDYAPPVSSLKNAAKPLKANWRASHTPWDISHAPDVEELDPAEIGVCETLRLFPIQYLANKRRLFSAKVETLKEGGKTFNKTAAQLVCNVDVNKASQLWDAFDKVGWFDRHWFEKFL